MQSYSEIAFKIINHFLKLYNDSIVSISGEIHNQEGSQNPLVELPLIEELAVAIRSRKAFPVLELTTANLRQRFFSEMPEEVLSISPRYYQNWIDDIDIFIEVNWKNLTSEFDYREAERFEVLKESSKEIWNKIFAQKKKIIFLNYPTSELAENIGRDFQDLHQAYLEALNCNYNWIKLTTEELLETYFPYSRYQISTASEQLKVQQSNEKPVSFLESGQLVILPAGYLEIPIQRNSLQGVFQATRVYYQGGVREDIKINFEEGKIRFVTFSEDQKGNFKLQNAIMNCREKCSLVIGYNPEVKNYTNYSLYDRCLRDSVSLHLTSADGRDILLSSNKAKITKINK